MNCVEYIENCLSAHADGELAAAELAEAEEHLRRCPGCRTRLDEERALKDLIKHRIQMRAAPAEVRRRLVEALDRAAVEEEKRGTSELNPPAGRRGLRAIRRPAVWVPLALAASIAVFFVATREIASNRPEPVVATAPSPDPEFDSAIRALDRFQHQFQPNLPSASSTELAQAYANKRMPDFIWNFERSGLALQGGRIEKLADGRRVGYTFYQGPDDSLLCIRSKVETPPPPGEAENFQGHYFYSYRGYSVCYAYMPDGFVCILVSRLPLDRMVQAVKIALQ